jgi:hypothetical protein
MTRLLTCARGRLAVTGEERSQRLGYPVVTRDVQFTGQGPKGDGTPVREVCTLIAPARVDFEQANGSMISNIVSKGPDGELLMTYSFAWVHDSVAEGSAEAKDLEERHWKVGLRLFAACIYICSCRTWPITAAARYGDPLSSSLTPISAC